MLIFIIILLLLLKSWCLTFLTKKSMCFIMKTWKLYFRLGLKIKKIHRVLEFSQSNWVKPYVEFNTQKRIEVEKNGDKDRKVSYKLMSNALYGKITKKIRNRIDVRLVSNKKDYLKWIPKPSYMSQKIIENDLVVILKK